MSSRLATRVRRVQKQLGSGGGCPECRGEQPVVVRYEDENGRALPGGSGAPCPGCGSAEEIVVKYIAMPLPHEFVGAA